jgi:hypothetical protein
MNTNYKLYKTAGNKKICVRLKNDGKECQNQLEKCDWCMNDLCPSMECIPDYMIYVKCEIWPRKQHSNCRECGTLTCSVKERCKKCENYEEEKK